MKRIITGFLFLRLIGAVSAQVGIGTTNPHPSSILEVVSGNKGLLIPRVALTGRNDVTTIPSPAKSLLVYNTTNTGGTAANDLSSGFYFFDGSKWQRMLNQQPDETISFNTTNPTNSGTLFTPNIPFDGDYIYVSNVDGRLWRWDGTAYTAYSPNVTSAWYLTGGTYDAGATKTADIYRPSSIGVGTSAPDPSALVDIYSKTKGVLTPRMTKNQRNAIPSPATGLILYCTNCTSAGTGCLSQNIGTPNAPVWECIGTNTGVTIIANCISSGFSGVLTPNTPSSGVYYIVKITNQAFNSVTITVSPADLIVSGTALGSLTITGVGLSPGVTGATSVTLAAGGSQLIYYSISGTPQAGQLVGEWKKNALSCSSSKTI